MNNTGLIKKEMSRKIILLILLFVTTCEGFFSIDLSTINNETISRLNLTCLYYDEILINCDYCVYQFYNNGSSTTINYDCIQITNTYKSQSQRCQGFSDTTDIGYGICSPLSFELFDISILCICATNMCNNNFTTCRSSVTNQIESNSSPSVLPSIISDLSTSISCVDTIYSSDSSLNISSYCGGYTSPYIDITKCNEYVINNTVLCVFMMSEGYQYPMALTEDSYNMYLATLIYEVIQFSQDSTIEEYYNSSSSYFYVNWNTTYNNDNDTTILDSETCLCAQNNCNFNVTSCLAANRSISISIQNSATSKFFLFC